MIEWIPEEILDYCRRHSGEESDLYRRLTAETAATQESPQMLSGPLVGALLQFLAHLTRAKRVLEIGTFTGYSALKMAEVLPEYGKVYTCENDSRCLTIARRFFEEAPWGNRIVVLEGQALDSIAQLKPYFDLIFIDADKVNYLKYYQRSLELLRKGGVVALDNALWSGRVLNPPDESARQITRTNEYIQKDRRVHNVLLPLRDGVMLVYRK